MEGRYLDALCSKALIAAMTRMEKTYHKHFGRILENPAPQFDEKPENILSGYNVRIEHTGESITYDGTSGNKNEAIVPYLDHLNRKRRSGNSSANAF